MGDLESLAAMPEAGKLDFEVLLNEKVAEFNGSVRISERDFSQ